MQYEYRDRFCYTSDKPHRWSIAGFFSSPERNSALLQSITARMSAIHVGTSRLYAASVYHTMHSNLRRYAIETAATAIDSYPTLCLPLTHSVWLEKS